MNARILVADALTGHAASIGNKTAIAGDARNISFRELHFLVEMVSLKLNGICASSDHVFGLCFSDPVKHLVVSLALLKNGVAQIAIPPWESVVAKKKMVATAVVRGIISDTLEWSGSGLLFVRVGADWTLSCEKGAHVIAQVTGNAWTASSAALVFLGSGTTGISKIMAVDFDLLGSLIERDLAVREFNAGERHYCPSSLDYFTAKRRAFGCLLAGVTVMLPRGLPLNLVRYCLEHDVQHLSMTTSQAAGFLSQGEDIASDNKPCLPAIRSFFVGSSPVSETVRQKIRQRISSQLFVVYGSNEFGEATVATPVDQDRHPGTVGRPCPGVTLEIVDDSGDICPAGVKGRIRLKSRQMMTGYVGDSVATERNFRGGYYYPGDLGAITPDGNLIYLGRLDDMMIFRGVNIFPRDIERVLESHPLVTDVAAFPLLTKEYEQIPFAVVCASGVSEAELLNYCREWLGWRRPQKIFFASELPRNSAGKVLKRRLAQIVAAKLSGK